MLTVVAEVNGRKLRLIVDTGWGPGGIFLHNDHIAGLGLKTEGIKGELMSASGHIMAGFKAGPRRSRAPRERGTGRRAHLFWRPPADQNRREHAQVRRRRFPRRGLYEDHFRHRRSAKPPRLPAPAGQGPPRHDWARFERRGHGRSRHERHHRGRGDQRLARQKMVDTGAYHAGIDLRFGEKIKAATRGSNVGLLDAAGKLRPTKLMQVKSFKIGGMPAPGSRSAPDQLRLLHLRRARRFARHGYSRAERRHHRFRLGEALLHPFEQIGGTRAAPVA